MYAEFEGNEFFEGVWGHKVRPGKGWDQTGTFDFENFLALGLCESNHPLMDSKVWAWEILKAAHHLILNALTKCWGNGAGKK